MYVEASGANSRKIGPQKVALFNMIGKGILWCIKPLTNLPDYQNKSDIILWKLKNILHRRKIKLYVDTNFLVEKKGEAFGEFITALDCEFQSLS